MTSVASRMPALAVWLLVAAIAVSLALWTWRLIPLRAGAQILPGAPQGNAAVDRLKDQNWFASLAVAKAQSTGRYTLRWLYPGRPGVCILGMPGLHDKTFRVGEEVEPGVKLKEVGSNYVVLESGAGMERIRRPERQDIPALPATDASGPVPAPAIPYSEQVAGRIPPDLENR